MVGEGFKAALAEDPMVQEHLTPAEIEHVLDLRYHLKHIDETFRRSGL